MWWLVCEASLSVLASGYGLRADMVMESHASVSQSNISAQLRLNMQWHNSVQCIRPTRFGFLSHCTRTLVSQWGMPTRKPHGAVPH